MKYTAAFIIASAAVASAQFTVNHDGSITCDASKPNASYCAGNSLQSNIIIRCTNGVGQAGNCVDNLSGTAPIDLYEAQCYTSGPLVGDAACEKNCLVYSPNGTYPVPASDNCVPLVTSSSLAISATSSASISASSPATTATDVLVTSTILTTSLYTITSCAATVTDCPARIGQVTSIVFATTTVCPVTASFVPAPTSAPALYSTLSTTIAAPSSGIPINSSNGTVVGVNTGSATTSGKATATPVGPSKTSSVPLTVTGAAMTNSAGTALALFGLVAAWFL